jgi:hypothetical protein
MTTIRPSVGRIVHYLPADSDTPFPAMIVEVLGGNQVAATVFRPEGRVEYRRLPLHDAGTGPKDGHRFEWAPFQQQQATQPSAN